MEDSSIDPLRSRIRILHTAKPGNSGKCILYVMSRDMRVRDNHALLSAQKHALRLGLPLAVVFVLRKVSQARSREQYGWMLEHLTTVERQLAGLDIPFMLLIGDAKDCLNGCINHLEPEALYFDFSPLQGPRNLVKAIARIAGPSVYLVDTHNVVPIWLASNKQEVGARTLRPKIHKLLQSFLVEPDIVDRHPHAWPGKVQSIDELKPKINEVVGSVKASGQQDLMNHHPVREGAAMDRLRDFVHYRLQRYAEDRNNPALDGLSELSPYLHFGAISSLRVTLEATVALQNDSSLQAGYETLVEELVVRKELSDNYCFYSPDYQSLDGAPMWAQATLAKHSGDVREFIYSLQDFEQAKTHDPAWNAAQRQLIRAGKMHGYMRMYWAKKVLEWSASPEQAIEILVYLNDFYSLDGGDPNGYTGIMWSVAGVHDRPWGERPVYGTVRSMVYNGLKRKFDIVAYERQWSP